jgi:short-subunit dehydrogenase
MPAIRKPIVWITGASRGIGAAIASAFAADGALVVLTGRSVPALRKKVKGIRDNGGEAAWFRCDVQNEKSVTLTFKAISTRYGKVDILVNNAGVTYFKPFARTTPHDFDHVLATNLRGLFLTAQSVLGGMMKRKNGVIVNILSVSAITTFKNSSAYSASKAGALALSRGLRAEVRKSGVRIIDILPGAVETTMWDREERKKYHSRMMQPEDVAEIVLAAVHSPKRLLTEEIVLRPISGDL